MSYVTVNIKSDDTGAWAVRSKMNSGQPHSTRYYQHSVLNQIIWLRMEHFYRSGKVSSKSYFTHTKMRFYRMPNIYAYQQKNLEKNPIF